VSSAAKFWIALLVVGVLLLLLVSVLPRQREPMLVVAVPDPSAGRFTIAGPVVGSRDAHATFAWRGIPYAAPPTGDLRWRAPFLPEPWQEVRSAVEFGPPCPQLWGPLAGVSGRPGDIVGDEDCLTLNVWSPQDAADDSGELLPVMVWLHGGGNSIGTASTYPGAALAGRQRVVVVTLNYRLGLLGWFSHPALREAAATAREASGNFALLDMLLALDWVQSNIMLFGGDPTRVTLFGESAGARNVLALMATPAAEGLFHRAIAQSGALGTSSREAAENLVDAPIPGHVLSSAEVMKAQLIAAGRAEDRRAAIAVQRLMVADEERAFLHARSAAQLLQGLSGPAGMYITPQLIRDGEILPQTSLLSVFSDPARYQAVPLLIGSNRDEMKTFLAQDPALVQRWLGFIPRIRDPALFAQLARYLSDGWKALAVDELAATITAADGSAPVYAYRWDWDEGARRLLVDFSELLGAGHGLEVGFVFGDFDHGIVIPGLFDAGNVVGRDALSAAMMEYWAEFAYAGDPGRGRAGTRELWQAWGSDGAFMVLDTPDGGGVRMSTEGIDARQLQQRLALDPELSPALRCQLYRDLFESEFHVRDFSDAVAAATMGC